VGAAGRAKVHLIVIVIVIVIVRAILGEAAGR
jgi:hypothetical protein